MSPAPVTFVFTNLSSSTELLQRPGDERAQRTLRAHLLLLKRVVSAHGGAAPRWLGDGFLSVFSSAADGVRCAAALQQAARGLVAGERLSVRVGLNLGESPRDESDYFGPAVLIARRLCDQACAGQILCNATFPALFTGQAGFRFRDRGALSLAGLPEPVPACEVEYRDEHPTALLTRTPFVGRTGEFARLHQRLRHASGGQGGLVMLVGEPGIGKTRTLEEVADAASTGAAVVLWGRCYEGEAARPYGPFVEALAGYASITSPETLRQDLGFGAAPLARLVPALRAALPDLPEPVALQPDEERVRVLDAMAQFFLSVAARSPVTLVLDDLHWADTGTIAMLRHLARFAARSRVLVLGAYREPEAQGNTALVDALGLLPRETAYEHLALAGLGREDVAELLASIADQDVPPALVTAIAAETSGNPFFIREVLLHLVEEGKLFQRERRWGSSLTIDGMGIPPSVRQVVERRLARLREPTRRLLVAASGSTGTFRLDLAARVAGLDEAAALDALDEALAAQLLRSTTAADTFDFTHALVRHTLFAQLSPPRRVRLHRQIAEAMDQVYGARAAEHADEIARHYYQSATLPGAEPGVAHCLVAAERAEQSAAFAEVAEYLRMALELSDANDSRRPRLLARLALALTWSLALDQAEQVGTQAAAAIAAAEGNDAAAEFLADAADALWLAAAMPRAWSLATLGLRYLGDRRDTTWARLMVLETQRREAADPRFPGIPVDSPERREVMTRLWELPAFRHLGQQMLAYMAFRSREDVLARAGNDPVHLFGLAGEHRKTLPLLEQATATALERGQIALATFYLTFTARIHTACGDFAASRAVYTRVRELYQRTSPSPMLRAHVGNVQFDHVALTGEGWELVLAGAEDMIQQGAQESQWWMAPIRAAAALCAAQLGRPDTALKWLATILPAIERAPGSAANYSLVVTAAATTLEELGRTDHIETLERNLRTKVLEPDLRYVGTDARLALAMLCGLQGRFEEAAEWFARARVILEEQGAAPLRALTDFYEARMYVRRDAPGDRDRETLLLHAALAQFRPLGMTGWTRRAEAMLAPVAQPLPEAEARGADSAQESRALPPPGGAIFRSEGDYWLLAYEGTSARLRDTRGFRDLAQLLRHPGQEFHVLDLMQGPAPDVPGSAGQATAGSRGAGLAILDAAAKAAYRHRLAELQEELQEAENFHDTGHASRAREELEAISHELAAAVGLGGATEPQPAPPSGHARP